MAESPLQATSGAATAGDTAKGAPVFGNRMRLLLLFFLADLLGIALGYVGISWALSQSLSRRIVGCWEGTGVTAASVNVGEDTVDATNAGGMRLQTTIQVSFFSDGTMTWHYKGQTAEGDFSLQLSLPDPSKPNELPTWKIVEQKGSTLRVRMFNAQDPEAQVYDFVFDGANTFFHRSEEANMTYQRVQCD